VSATLYFVFYVFALGAALAIGWLLGNRDVEKSRERVDNLLVGYASMWAGARDAETARVVHNLLVDLCPELHEQFHDLADPLVASRGQRERQSMEDVH